MCASICFCLKIQFGISYIAQKCLINLFISTLFKSLILFTCKFWYFIKLCISSRYSRLLTDYCFTSVINIWFILCENMIARNPGCELDIGWLNNININPNAVNTAVEDLLNSRELKDEHKAAWLLRAITCIDLTTLAGDDTGSNILRLCLKATKPLPEDLLNQLGFEYGESCPITTAAVCVYPSRVEDAVKALKRSHVFHKVNVASVATGFPSGQMPLKTRLEEIRYAVEKGVTEIDIVIDRSLVLTGRWEVLYQEVQQMKKACGQKAHMKAILATGELGTLNNVYKASLVAMMAGTDFIKTSTGKESVNATLQFGMVMSRAIREYYDKFNYKVGLKPAGGIRTGSDAISWLIMVKEVLGNEWLNNELFRFGASGLLADIEYNLYKYGTKYYPAFYEFTVG